MSVILEASAPILESHGLHAFNANAIAARAGVSIGSLYRYFPNSRCNPALLALIGRFEEALHDAVLKRHARWKRTGAETTPQVTSAGTRDGTLRPPRLNRVVEAGEERLGSGADGAAFHASVLQLLQEHKNELAVPVSAATERAIIAILRALVDLGLASGVSRRSAEQQAMRAVCGYLLYGG